ncbi:GMC family oxidoreductase, partial [Pseudomonas sp. BGM005]|nr:GMC family oxidoreductase [Pseudomonas sp. BG5]
KTLATAFAANGKGGERLVELLPQAVASKVNIDPDSGKVRSLEVKIYKDPASPAHETITVKGKVFVLAAGAIETARLML